MAHHLAPGTQIDGFTVGAHLFSGGAAHLYAVSHPDHSLSLIMKVPRLGPDEPIFGIVGFETECTLLPALRGHHVPRLISACPQAAQPYIVMERVWGQDLKRLIQPGGLSLEALTELGFAIAAAAHSLHRQDAIHLDIKPDNLIIRENGEAVLIDFGFAHHASYPDLFHEENRMAVGSTPYIAPEQVAGVRDDPRSDQFAIGVTLYQLATGQLPFGIPVSLAEMRKRLWTEPTPLRALRPDLPPWFQEIVLTCMAPDPERRFASCGLLAQAFAYPASVPLTERATRLKKDGLLQQLWRAWRYRPEPAHARRTPVSPSERVEAAPLFLVVFDPFLEDPALSRALQYAVVRILQRHPDSRLACLTVLDAQSDDPRDSSASERHHDYRVALHHWVRQLDISEERLSMHVFESPDPAQRIIEYARRNSVDVIIMSGTREPPPFFRLNRSVMTRVVEEAPCSIHIVRAVNEQS